jgi:hypothetical protein
MVYSRLGAEIASCGFKEIFFCFILHSAVFGDTMCTLLADICRRAYDLRGLSHSSK